MEELKRQDEVQPESNEQNAGENPFGIKQEDVQTPEQPQVEEVVKEKVVEVPVEEVPDEEGEKKGFFAKLFGK